jgi:hypothetical protein
MPTTTIPRRAIRASAGAPQRTRATVTAVAAAAYVYVLDSSNDRGCTWNTVGCDRVSAPSARIAADRLAGLFHVDAATSPTVLRVRVWTWPGVTVPAGQARSIMLGSPPDAARQTDRPRNRR